MEFGTKETTSAALDEFGSRITEIENYKDWKSVGVRRVVYKPRFRVRNKEDEHRVIIRFSDMCEKDKTMLEPQIWFEHNRLGKDNGFYYVITSYTRLEK